LLVQSVLGSETLELPAGDPEVDADSSEQGFLGPVTLTGERTIQWIKTGRIPLPRFVATSGENVINSKHTET
jgi:hypothetical protein